jgi:hypothetical protein
MRSPKHLQNPVRTWIKLVRHTRMTFIGDLTSYYGNGLFDSMLPPREPLQP